MAKDSTSMRCPFYSMTGACRRGDECPSIHDRPSISRTLLLSNLYQRPDPIAPGVGPKCKLIDPVRLREHLEAFYEDIYDKLNMYGVIESIDVCDNLADHMVGNVYVRYKEEGQAADALECLQGRTYGYPGRPIVAEFSPVTDFRQATCRMFEKKSCPRGGYCNSVHPKKIGRELRRTLFEL